MGDGQPQLQSGCFDRAWRSSASATPALVGARHDEHDIVARFDKGPERWDSYVRSAQVDQFHDDARFKPVKITAYRGDGAVGDDRPQLRPLPPFGDTP